MGCSACVDGSGQLGKWVISLDAYRRGVRCDLSELAQRLTSLSTSVTLTETPPIQVLADGRSSSWYSNVGGKIRGRAVEVGYRWNVEGRPSIDEPLMI